MFPLFLAVVGLAAADPLPVSTVTQTRTFSFDWTGIVSGSTTFDFEPGTRTFGSQACIDVAGCQTGAFNTGNGGNGTYRTGLEIDNCVVLSELDLGFFVRTEEICDVSQTLSLDYVDTTGAPLANYTGAAGCGTVTGIRRVLFGLDLGLGSRVYTYVAGSFSGTTSTPGGFTGTFTE